MNSFKTLHLSEQLQEKTEPSEPGSADQILSPQTIARVLDVDTTQTKLVQDQPAKIEPVPVQ